MKNEHDTIEQRLGKLERQNRRMKLAGVGALVIAGAFLLMGQARAPRTLPEVRARDFILEDAQGRERANLTVASAGPGLVLYGEDGKLRVGLSVWSDGPGLHLYNATGSEGIVMHMPSEGPEFYVYDANGFETDIGITGLISPTTGETRKTSAASIVLFGKDQKVLWSAPQGQ